MKRVQEGASPERYPPSAAAGQSQRHMKLLLNCRCLPPINWSNSLTAAWAGHFCRPPRIFAHQSVEVGILGVRRFPRNRCSDPRMGGGKPPDLPGTRTQLWRLGKDDALHRQPRAAVNGERYGTAHSELLCLCQWPIHQPWTKFAGRTVPSRGRRSGGKEPYLGRFGNRFMILCGTGSPCGSMTIIGTSYSVTIASTRRH